MKAAKASFDASVDGGITFFDTTEVYGAGERQEKESVEVAVATKYAALPWRLGRGSVISALKDSLSRLGLSSVDLYQLHWPEIWGNEGYLDGLGDAVEQGLVKVVRVSNYSEKRLRDAHDRFKKRGITLASNQYYGLRSETRKTSTWDPVSYGIEVTKPEDVPEGYEERWMLNVHAIDIRGAEDRLGCTECKCSLYNVTEDQHGRPLGKDYIGGLLCCYDGTQCPVKDGFNGVGRKLYLRYTVRWTEWDDNIVPVKIYIFDVTDSRALPNDSTDGDHRTCKIEYEVKPCSLESRGKVECVDVKKTEVTIPHGGDIVYGVAHQHTGGLGSALYG